MAIRRDIENQVRSLIKEYGLLFPRAIGKQFRNQVSELLGEDHQLLGVIAPLLSIHEHICEQQSKFDDEVRRRDDTSPDDGSWCRRGDGLNLPPYNR